MRQTSGKLGWELELRKSVTSGHRTANPRGRDSSGLNAKSHTRACGAQPASRDKPTSTDRYAETPHPQSAMQQVASLDVTTP